MTNENPKGTLARRVLALAAALAFCLPSASPAAESSDVIGDLLGRMAQSVEPILETFGLKATLYHSGGRGILARDSLGCKVVPMRTAAVDGISVPRHTILFIKETVGLPMPNGGHHDGYWFASDTGGGIHKGRIDLFTGKGAASMAALMHLNLSTLTVAKVGIFSGCPSA